MVSLDKIRELNAQIDKQNAEAAEARMQLKYEIKKLQELTDQYREETGVDLWDGDLSVLKKKVDKAFQEESAKVEKAYKQAQEELRKIQEGNFTTEDVELEYNGAGAKREGNTLGGNTVREVEEFEGNQNINDIAYEFEEDTLGDLDGLLDDFDDNLDESPKPIKQKPKQAEEDFSFDALIEGAVFDD